MLLLATLLLAGQFRSIDPKDVEFRDQLNAINGRGIASAEDRHADLDLVFERIPPTKRRLQETLWTLMRIPPRGQIGPNSPILPPSGGVPLVDLFDPTCRWVSRSDYSGPAFAEFVRGTIRGLNGDWIGRHSIAADEDQFFAVVASIHAMRHLERPGADLPQLLLLLSSRQVYPTPTAKFDVPMDPDKPRPRAPERSISAAAATTLARWIAAGRVPAEYRVNLEWELRRQQKSREAAKPFAEWRPDLMHKVANLSDLCMLWRAEALFILDSGDQQSIEDIHRLLELKSAEKKVERELIDAIVEVVATGAKFSWNDLMKAKGIAKRAGVPWAEKRIAENIAKREAASSKAWRDRVDSWKAWGESIGPGIRRRWNYWIP
ncbi:MAG TPA: hypothetical protein VNC50_12120 [Planctomycetia bacterium]|nr:hypothetical protein [Planctomycetia bacterium]